MTPETEIHLADLIRGANGPLRLRGGGTRQIGVPVGGDVLDLTGFRGISLYEPGALTLVAGSGTPLAEIRAALEVEGQRLAFEPMDHRGLLATEGEPTIGGVFAANVSGPRRVQVGAARDFLLGVRFVDGRGNIISNGGRVMKNVTGYDLVKLMAGSFGTLGALTQVSFKVLAKPETEATLVCYEKDASAGVAALSAALATPYDVTGAAYLETGGVARAQVRLEGLAPSVAYRAQSLQAGALAGFCIAEGEDSATLWDEVRDVTPFVGLPGAVWRISVKPTDAPVLTSALQDRGVGNGAIYDWGGGLIWLLTDDTGDAGAAVIRGQVAQIGGHATLIRASEETRRAVPVFQPQPTPLAKIEAGIRAQFDPRGILNTGLMG